jgi:DNA-binding transcriptional regulator YiaG
MSKRPRNWQPILSGAEIQQLREDAKLSQAQLANLIGVHPNTISRWEREDMYITEPVARFLKLICEQAQKSSEPP